MIDINWINVIDKIRETCISWLAANFTLTDLKYRELKNRKRLHLTGIILDIFAMSTFYAKNIHCTRAKLISIVRADVAGSLVLTDHNLSRARKTDSTSSFTSSSERVTLTHWATNMQNVYS